MSTQEAYESIRNYFSRPGAVLAKDGTSTYSTCKYRTRQGQACAVGCLIPDDLYRDVLEGYPLDRDWLDRFPSIDEYLRDVDKKFLRSAQLLHDSVARDAESFLIGLDVVALLFGLEVVDDTVISGDDFLND